MKLTPKNASTRSPPPPPPPLNMRFSHAVLDLSLNTEASCFSNRSFNDSHILPHI